MSTRLMPLGRRSQNPSRMQRQPAFELLETRNLLAGNVLASVVSGNLVLTGDNLGNGVVVSQVNDATYKVSGLVWDGRPTTINGRNEVLITGVRNHVLVDLRSGRDALVISNKTVTPSMVMNPTAAMFANVNLVRIPVDLKVTGTAGDDVVILGGVSVGRDAIVAGGADADRMLVAHSLIASNLRLSGDAGNDNVTVANSSIGYRLTLEDSIGVNQLSVTGVVSGFVDVVTGIGTDTVTVSKSTISFLNVNTGSGNDLVTLERLLVSNVKVETGFGNDTVQVVELTVLGNATIQTGDGNDVVDFRTHSAAATNAVRGKLTIDTGTGADRALLNRVVTDQLFAYMGDGDDFLSLANTRANQTLLDGGFGTRDQFQNLTGNDLRRRTVTRFEQIR